MITDEDFKQANIDLVEYVSDAVTDAAHKIYDATVGKLFSKEEERDIDDIDNPEEWPENPDDWVPPDGVSEEDKTREATDGRHRQWKDEEGNTVRRWDESGREAGKDRGPHWHDTTGRHIPPGGGCAD
jgi:hypothetical protein